MPAGDQLAHKGDIEWDGLLISGVPELRDEYGNFLEQPEGFFYDADTGVEGLGVPPLRAVEQDQDGDGTFGAAAGGRMGRPVVIGRLYVSGRESLFELRRRMVRAPADEALWFQGMGPAQLDDEQFLCYPTRVTFTYVEDTQAQEHGIMAVTAEWYCDDPRIYGATETATVLGGDTPVPNDGIEVAPWRLVIEADQAAAVVGPRIRRRDDDTRFLIDFADVTIGVGDELVMDTRAGYVTLDGVRIDGQARSGAKLAEWWPIPVGGENVGVASDSGAFTATIYTRDTYL